MSISLFRFPPAAFIKHDDFERYGVRPDTDSIAKGKPKCEASALHKNEPVFLRDDHLVLFAIDALLALREVVKHSIARRRTRQILSALDDRQLRDIGLTRSQIDDRKIG